MRERPLSASSVKTFLQCILKYYYHYEEKRPAAGNTNALAFGTSLHVALEEMYKETSGSKVKPTPEVYDKIIQLFMKTASKEGLSDYSLYDEGRDILISRLDAIDPEEKILGLELDFELKTPDGTPFKGSIDKLVEIDEDTVAVIDYKSSRMALTQDEADIDIQLSMYDLAVSMLYPQYSTVLCALDYLRLGEVITHRTEEQRAVFVEFLDAVYASICETEKDDIKASLNSFCGWCEYKGYCPDYNKMLAHPDQVLPPLNTLDDENFVDAWIIYEAAKKIYDNRANEFKEAAYARLNKSETIRGKDSEIYRVQNGRKVYDNRSIFKIVGPERYVDMASVGKPTLDKYLRDNPHHIEAIEEASTFVFNNPSFRVRKIKPSNDNK